MKKIFIIIVLLAAVFCVGGAGAFYYINQSSKERTYTEALSARDSGDYEKALTLLDEVGSFKDAEKVRQECENLILIKKANELLEDDDYAGASDLYRQAGSDDETIFQVGKEYYDSKEWAKAIAVFEAIKGYNKVDSLLDDAKYHYAEELYATDQFNDALSLLDGIEGDEGVNALKLKCELGKKYVRFDYDSFYLFDSEEDISKWSHERIREEVESLCSSLFYKTWYYNGSDSDATYIIDMEKIDGKEYGVLSYQDRRAEGAILNIFFQDSDDSPHSIELSYNYDFSMFIPVVDYIEVDGTYWCDVEASLLEEYSDAQYQIESDNAKKVIYEYAIKDYARYGGNISIKYWYKVGPFINEWYSAIDDCDFYYGSDQCTLEFSHIILNNKGEYHSFRIQGVYDISNGYVKTGTYTNLGEETVK